MKMIILSAALALGALCFVSAPAAEAGGRHGGFGFRSSYGSCYRGGYGSGYGRYYRGSYYRHRHQGYYPSWGGYWGGYGSYSRGYCW